MKAVILCGGLGSRLGLLTSNCPKPLLMFQGKTILEWQILLLKKYDVKEIYINLYYLGEKIVSYIGNGKKYGVKIFYKHQESLNGTAGGVKIFEKELAGSNPFFVFYGDIIIYENLNRMIDHFKKTRALCTIFMHKNINSNSFIITKNKNNLITEFYERPSSKQKNIILTNYDSKNIWSNSSIYLMSPCILKSLALKSYLDFPKDVFPELVRRQKLFGLPLKENRFAIDSKEKYYNAIKYFSEEFSGKFH